MEPKKLDHLLMSSRSWQLNRSGQTREILPDDATDTIGEMVNLYISGSKERSIRQIFGGDVLHQTLHAPGLRWLSKTSKFALIERQPKRLNGVALPWMVHLVALNDSAEVTSVRAFVSDRPMIDTDSVIHLAETPLDVPFQLATPAPIDDAVKQFWVAHLDEVEMSAEASLAENYKVLCGEAISVGNVLKLTSTNTPETSDIFNVVNNPTATDVFNLIEKFLSGENGP